MGHDVRSGIYEWRGLVFLVLGHAMATEPRYVVNVQDLGFLVASVFDGGEKRLKVANEIERKFKHFIDGLEFQNRFVGVCGVRVSDVLRFVFLTILNMAV
jgi:hypothetical protein